MVNFSASSIGRATDQTEDAGSQPMMCSTIYSDKIFMVATQIAYGRSTAKGEA